MLAVTKTAAEGRTITINLSVPAKLVDDVMRMSYPEYSSSSIECVGFMYKACVYKFVDTETGKNYTLRRHNLEKGLRIMFKKLAAGKLPGIAQYLMTAPLDAASWDCIATDALVQCAIFGDVIYG